MLGDEYACTVEAQHDALGELGNVICGNVLPAVAGAAATFSLQPPRLVDPAQATTAGCEVAGAGTGTDSIRAETAVIRVGLGPGRAEVYFTAHEAAEGERNRRAA